MKNDEKKGKVLTLLALSGGLGFIFYSLMEIVTNIVELIKCRIRIKKLKKENDELEVRRTKTHKFTMEFVDKSMDDEIEMPRNPQAEKLYARLQKWQEVMHKVIDDGDVFSSYYRKWSDDVDLYNIINVDYEK